MAALTGTVSAIRKGEGYANFDVTYTGPDDLVFSTTIKINVGTSSTNVDGQINDTGIELYNGIIAAESAEDTWLASINCPVGHQVVIDTDPT